MAEKRDDLDSFVAETDKHEPGFAARVEAEVQRLALIEELRALRLEKGLSQTRVAADMNASQSQVAEIEAGPKLRTTYEAEDPADHGTWQGTKHPPGD